jgi:hypothetical protein
MLRGIARPDCQHLSVNIAIVLPARLSKHHDDGLLISKLAQLFRAFATN